MGKTKPRRRNRRRHRSNPTGIKSIKDTKLEESKESELDSSSLDELLQGITEEIQSVKNREKLFGLQSLVALADKTQNIEPIINCKILKILAPLLVDKDSEVRNMTAGVLRNLSASGSMDVCERLVREDIMTPLLALLHQYIDWTPESAKGEDSDTLLQLVNILWNLCETDETALKYFNSANIMSVILSCLDHRTVGLDLSISACNFLNSVSEDNPAVISALRSREAYLLSLLTIDSVNNRLMLLKTLAAGIVVNMNPLSTWLPKVLSVIEEALRSDVHNVVSMPWILDDSAKLAPNIKKQMDRAMELIEAQSKALEILANLTASQDDEMDEGSEASSDDEDEKLSSWTEADNSQPLALNTEVGEALAKYQLVATVFTKVELFPENVMNVINNCHSPCLMSKRLVQMQCRALLCLNNLVAVVDAEQLGGAHQLYSLAKRICTQRLHTDDLTKPLTASSLELLEASTAVLRAIFLRLASMKFNDVEDISSKDLEMIFKVGLGSELRVQANIFRIVGTLGVMLAGRNHELAQMAGSYLVEHAEKKLPLWLTAEALDSVMDVFGEDSTDVAAAEIDLIPRLLSISPRLKTKMRQERRTLGEHFPLVSTVMANLEPFIKYKMHRLEVLRMSPCL